VFAEKFLAFLLAEVIQHHEAIASDRAQDIAPDGAPRA
jgi:chorismate mutase